jgi:hypothetical protein
MPRSPFALFRFPLEFGFLLNPFSFGGDLPLQCAEGVGIDKATPSERDTIRGLLKALGESIRFGRLFDFEPVPREIRDSSTWDRKLWPRETYWVIRGGDSKLLEGLCAASQLCDCELELGAAFPPASNVSPRMINQSSFFYYPHAHWNGDTQPLEASDIALIDPLRLRLEEFEAAREDDEIRGSIIRLFEKFISLSAGKRFGEMALLGHFAILEGLITHQSKPERGDSINHQLKTKMPLLMRRFQRPLNLADHIDVTDPAKAWGLLYGLRSRIAHGGKEFSSEIDSKLRNSESVFRLVRESLKRIFLVAIHEPEFLFDLRAC